MAAERMMKKLVLGACVVAMAITAGCSYSTGFSRAKAKDTRHLTAAHVNGGSVVVDTSNGSVELVADPSVSEVMITAHVTATDSTQAAADARLAATTIQVARDTNRVLTIQPVFPTKARNGDGASFIIRMPQATGVNVDTSNGSITVSGFAGELVLDTSNGPVKVSDHNGPVLIDTSNGGVTVTNIAGNVEADTSNWPVDVRGIAGSANVRTSNGNITAQLNGDQSGPLTLITSNGSVNAVVGQAFSSTVSLATSNGRVSVIDPQGACTKKSMHKTSGSVTVGDGQTESKIATSNGSVTLTISDAS